MLKYLQKVINYTYRKGDIDNIRSLQIKIGLIK